jgi:predicted  nucleic acid-binding Zn-ribbon protein
MQHAATLGTTCARLRGEIDEAGRHRQELEHHLQESKDANLELHSRIENMKSSHSELESSIEFWKREGMF